MHTAVLYSGANVHAPANIKERLEDGREDARATGPANGGIEVTVLVFYNCRGCGRQRAFPGLRIIVCKAMSVSMVVWHHMTSVHTRRRVEPERVGNSGR